ncbi:MAG TPA: hypothetical protein VKE74_18210, partial [Gemmataceae bacterium]|nr:hypothetical protein [Gemmataceae bacterium]
LSGTRPAEVIDPSKKNGLRGDEATANGTANPPTQSPVPLTEATVPEIWGRLIRYLTDKSPILATHLKVASLPAIFGPNSLAIRFHTRYSQEYDACASEANLDRLQDALRKITGQPLTIRVEPVGGPAPPPRRPESSPAGPAADRRKRLMELPLFKKAGEALGAQIWHVDDGFNPVSARPAGPQPTAPQDDEPLAPEPDTDEG